MTPITFIQKKLVSTTDRYSTILIFLICIIVSIILVFLSLKYLIILILGIAIIGIIVHSPRIGLYAILLLSPYYFIINSILTTGEVGFVTHFSPVDILTVVTLSGVYLRIIAKNQITSRLSSTDILCAGWVLLALISLGIGIVAGNEAAYRIARGPLLYGLYFVAVAEINSDRRIRELFWVLLVNSITIGLVGIAGSLKKLEILFPNLSVGIIGDSYTRSNYFGEPALAIPNILFLVLMLKYNKKQYHYPKILLRIAMLLEVCVLMLSVTRGFWLGMVSALIVMSFVLVHFKFATKRQILSLVFSVGFAILIVEGIFRVTQNISITKATFDRVESAINNEDPNMPFRVNEFYVYFSSFMKSPLIGHGFGSSLYVSGFVPSLGFAHNEYIWILQTTGVLGILVLGCIWFQCIRLGLWRIARSTKVGAEEIVSILLITMAAGYFVTALSSPVLINNAATVPLFVTLLGTIRAITVIPIQTPKTI